MNRAGTPGTLETKADDPKISPPTYVEQLRHEVNEFITFLQAYQPFEAMDIDTEQQGDDGDWGDIEIDEDDDFNLPTSQVYKISRSTQNILTQYGKLFIFLGQDPNRIFKISSTQVSDVQDIVQELKDEVRNFRTSQGGNLLGELEDCLTKVSTLCYTVDDGLRQMSEIIDKPELHWIDVNNFETKLRNLRDEMEQANSSSSSGKAEATTLNGECKQFVIDVCQAILKVAEYWIDETRYSEQLNRFYLRHKQANISTLLEWLQQDNFVFSVDDDNEVKNLISFVNSALKKLDDQLHQGNNESDGETVLNKPTWDYFCKRVIAKVDDSRLTGCGRDNNNNFAEIWKLSLCSEIESSIDHEEKPDTVAFVKKICDIIARAIESLKYSNDDDITPETKRTLAVFIKYWLKQKLSPKLRYYEKIIFAVEKNTNAFMQYLSEGKRPSTSREKPSPRELELAIANERNHHIKTSGTLNLFGASSAKSSAPTSHSSSDQPSVIQRIVTQLKEIIRDCKNEKANANASDVDVAVHEQTLILRIEGVMNQHLEALCALEGSELETAISEACSIQNELSNSIAGLGEDTITEINNTTTGLIDSLRAILEGDSSSSRLSEIPALTDSWIQAAKERVNVVIQDGNENAVGDTINDIITTLSTSNSTPDEKRRIASTIREMLNVLSAIFPENSAIANSMMTDFVDRLPRESEAASSASSSSSSSSSFSGSHRKRSEPDPTQDNDGSKRQRVSLFPDLTSPPASSNSEPEPMDDATEANEQQSTSSQPPPSSSA